MNTLYIASIEGTPPLNYFQKFIYQKEGVDLDIMILPTYKRNFDGVEVESMINIDSKVHYKTFKCRFIHNQGLQYFVHYIFVLLGFFSLSKYIKKDFDICIAEPSFNAAMMFFIKSKIKTKVFMNGDIFISANNLTEGQFLQRGQRSVSSKLIEKFLLFFQRYIKKIAYKSDLVWYTSKKVYQYEKYHGYIPKKYIIRPGAGIDYDSISLKHNISNNVIGFIGRLDENAGIDIILNCMEILINKMPDIELAVIGGSEEQVQYYQQYAEKIGVSDNVRFYGFIPSKKQVLELLSEMKLGLALYKPGENNVSYYTQPGKVFDYFMAGLPIIISKDGPEISNEIAKFGSGLVVEYNIKSISEAIIKLLNNNKLNQNARIAILDHAKHYSYNEVFSNLLESIEKKKNI